MRWPSLQSVLAVVALAAIGLGVRASCPASIWKPEANQTLSNPLLALELASSVAELPAIAGPMADPRRAILRQVIMADFAFLVAYPVLFILIWLRIWRRRPPGPGLRLVGGVSIAAALLGALCDVRENLAMLTLLGDHDACPRAWSVVKWSLLFGCLGTSAMVYFDGKVPAFRRIVIGYAAALSSGFAAAVGLGGVVGQKDAMIETGARFIAVSLLFGFFYFASHRFLNAGLSPGLDRVASWWLLRKIALWPADDLIDDRWIFLPTPNPALDNGWAKRRGDKVVLKDWVLTSAPDGDDGGSLVLVSRAGGRVEGLLYEVPAAHLAAAVPDGLHLYQAQEVKVELEGREVAATAFVAPGPAAP